MTMPNKGYAAYQTATVQTASPEKLLIMLYDGLIRVLETAKTAIDAKDIEKSNQQLIKAQDIIRELKVTLKVDSEVSQQLSTIYDYFNQRLVDANVKKMAEPINDILPLIKELRTTWQQAAAQLKSVAAPAYAGSKL